MSMRVRPLTPSDAVAARDVRLEGLRLSPENFGASWEDEAVKPLTWWRDRLQGPAHWLGAESGNTLLGLTVVSLNQHAKLAHNADINAVYVRDAFRRRGVGALLMQSAMELLRAKGIAFATLTVNAENDAAQRLYARFGFTVCGQLQRGLFVNNRFYDELLMRRGIN